MKHNRLNDHSQASMPAKWFRKNGEEEEEGALHAGRRKRMGHFRGETEEDHSSGEAENDDALTRGGGRGGGR